MGAQNFAALPQNLLALAPQQLMTTPLTPATSYALKEVFCVKFLEIRNAIH